MKKIFLTIVFFGNFYLVFAQIPNLTPIADTTLINGLRLIFVQKPELDSVYLSVFIEYPVIRQSSLIGIDRVFAKVSNGRLIGGNIYQRLEKTDSARFKSAFKRLIYAVYQKEYKSTDIFLARVDLQRNVKITVNAAKILPLGRKTYLTKDYSRYLGKDTVLFFRKLFSADHTTFVIYGDFNPQTALRFASSLTDTLPVRPLIYPKPFVPKQPFTVNWIEMSDTSLIGFSKILNLNLKDNYLEHLVYRFYLESKFPNMQIACFPSDFIGIMYGYMPAKNFTYNLKKLINAFEQIDKKDFNPTEIRTLKTKLTGFLAQSLQNPWTLTQYIFFLHHYKLPDNYLQTIWQKAENLSPTSIKNLKNLHFADSITIIMIGNRLKHSCDLLLMSENHKIYIADSLIYKYDVIPKGFNAWTVINRYIRFVSPQKPFKNLKIQFDGLFFADSNFYKLTGFIWKKAPNLYRFESYLILPTDTIFHFLSIFNGQNWYDSSLIGKMPHNQAQQLQTYIISEIYYRKFGYKPKLICEPNDPLIINKIYKILVQQPDGSFAIDIYDGRTQEKLQSQVFTADSTWQVSFYYYDYTRVQARKTDMKIPFVIIEQTPFYTLQMRINNISTRSVRKRVFSPKFSPMLK